MTSMKKLLVVDDSAFMRKLITEFFKGNNEIEVVGTARNGLDAIEKVKKLRPDVVTMDVEMPEMNGVEALKKIMQDTPTPVVMLSSTTTSDATITVEAISNGAVDFVAKPSGTISLDLDKIKHQLIEKVVAATKVSVTNLKQISKTTMPVIKPNLVESAPVVAQPKNESWQKFKKKIVVIGTSTGGPRALQEVLTSLPKNINAPILIVQHMPAGFTNSLAKRLDQLSEITVKEAENGEILQPGVAYIAPGGNQMTIRKVGMTKTIYIDKTSPAVGGHKPAVDVLFNSVSELTDIDRIAVIMTGMGADGTKGVRELKRTGNTRVISEDESTCVVYGMPKSVEKTGLVDRVEKLENISTAILGYLE